MSILNIQQIQSGVVGLPIQQWLIDTDDTLATVTTTGYLNGVRQTYSYPFSDKDFAQVYTTDEATVYLQVNVSADNTSVSLVNPLETIAVEEATNLAGGAANRIPYQTAASTTAFLAAAANGVLVTNGSSVPSISSTLPASLAMTTPKITTSILDANGVTILGLSATASAVNYISIANSATGNVVTMSAAGTDTDIGYRISPKGAGDVSIGTGTSSIVDFLKTDAGRARFSLANITASTVRTYTFPDVSGNFLLSAGVNTMAASSSIVLAKVNGTEAGNAVTASGVAGVVTTSSLTTVAGSSYAITWTNTFISSTSVVMLSISGGTNTRQNFRMSLVPGAGTATLTIYNNEPTNALDGTLLISYSVL